MNTKEKYYLFAYGKIQKGQPFHSILLKSKFIGYDSIKGFMLLDMKDIPVAIASKLSQRSKIYVEVYEVSRNEIKVLDNLYDAPNKFNRAIVKSVKGMFGVLYFAENRKSSLKGFGKIIKTDWNKYVEDCNKKEEKKKKRKIEEELRKTEEENKKKAKNNKKKEVAK